jgi:hypothetical protein
MLRPTDNAFPCPRDGERGLNVREYFALTLLQGFGHAMQGASIPIDAAPREAIDKTYEAIAAECVRMADALIVALNKR